MNSDSRWLSDVRELFTDPAIHNAYRTLLQSVTICPVKIQMCSAQHAEDGKDMTNSAGNRLWSGCGPWYWYVSLAQADKHRLRINQLRQIRYITRGARTGRNNKDAATRQQPEGTTSSTWAHRQTWLHFSISCVSSQHSPNTVTRLSHNSIGHGVVGVNMVVTGCSSQHTAWKRLSWDETFCPRSCEHHPLTIRSPHRRTRTVSQLLPISDPNYSDWSSCTLETFEFLH